MSIGLLDKVDELAERVAKLERAAMHCNTCGGRCDGDCEEGDEQFENERLASGQLVARLDTLGPKLPTCEEWCGELRPNVCCGDARLPFASGQLASAGDATVPAGWKLAPGWVTCGSALWCWHGTPSEPVSTADHQCDEDASFIVEPANENGDQPGVCAAHAVEMGALVRDEPPVERKCPSCFRVLIEGPCSVCWAAAPYDILPEQPSRQETAGGETATCPRDWCGGTGESFPYEQPVWENDPVSVNPLKNGRHFCSWACRDRAKAKAAELAKKEELADSFVEHMRPLMVTEAGRALMSGTAEPSGAGQFPSAPVWFPHKFAEFVAEQEANKPKAIAEPPAPAAGTLSPESALMGHQQAALLRRIDELHALLAAAVRERDEWHARYESQRQEVLRWQDREEELLVLRRELGEATAKERERCLAWFDAWQDDDVTTTAGMIDGITTGAPAPWTDK